MAIPDFKPTQTFLDEIEILCLVAKVKNSLLPRVATRYISKYKKDPVCEIYVRNADPNELAGWPKEILQQLLEQDGLPLLSKRG